MAVEAAHARIGLLSKASQQHAGNHKSLVQHQWQTRQQSRLAFSLKLLSTRGSALNMRMMRVICLLCQLLLLAGHHGAAAAAAATAAQQRAICPAPAAANGHPDAGLRA
jgi:hypothetical protein